MTPAQVTGVIATQRRPRPRGTYPAPRGYKSRACYEEVLLTTLGPDQILDLAAEQPQPRVPVHRGSPVLELARADRRDDLVLR